MQVKKEPGVDLDTNAIVDETLPSEQVNHQDIQESGETTAQENEEQIE